MKFLFLSLLFISSSLFSMDSVEQQPENEWKKLKIGDVIITDGIQRSFYYNPVDKKMYFSEFKSLKSYCDFPIPLEDFNSKYCKVSTVKVTNINEWSLMGLVQLPKSKLILLAMTADKSREKDALFLSIWDSKFAYPDNYCCLNIPENMGLEYVEFFKKNDSKSIKVEVLASAKDNNMRARMRGEFNITDKNRLHAIKWGIYKRMNDISNTH
jgi:hypothetical protein